ncbi:MAG TPA: adenosylcobinamide-phosphate synthase CbiB [Bacilli bacterium]
MSGAAALVLAYVLDRIIGDPRGVLHPVVVMGWCAAKLERLLREVARSPHSLKIAGVLLPVGLVGGSFFTAKLVLYAAGLLHPAAAFAANAWLISTTIATKGLADAGMQVCRLLRAGDVKKARESLAMIVGRDTEHLDTPEICRGAVETIAENIVDAIVAPLVFAAIGGAPLALAYRAANTLDSMVGYKNAKYRHFGWASARLDDIANFIPARISALFVVAAAKLLKMRARGAWRIIRRDARKHPSPNSGFPEAGVAGALGVRLGGTNVYQGVPSFRAYLGDCERELAPDDIARTVRLMKTVSVLFIAVCSGTVLLLESLRACAKELF